MKACSFALLAASLIGLSTASFFGRTQSVGARGRLFCGNKPASNVKVALYDQDDGLDPDDEMDSTFTQHDGSFSLQGSEKELTPIDPELRIYHDCNHGMTPCLREWIIQIPNKYIFKAASPGKTFNLGEINLEPELEDEDVECL